MGQFRISPPNQSYLLLLSSYTRNVTYTALVAISLGQMSKLFFYIVLTLLLNYRVYGQESENFTGVLDTKFYLSATYQLDDSTKAKGEKWIREYKSKELMVRDYLTKLNSGDEKGANKIIRKDKQLKEDGEFIIKMMYTLLRMKELGILYRPCFTLNDDKAKNAIISCSTEQLAELRKGNREFNFQCSYLGHLYVDNLRAFELVSFK